MVYNTVQVNNQLGTTKMYQKKEFLYQYFYKATLNRGPDGCPSFSPHLMVQGTSQQYSPKWATQCQGTTEKNYYCDYCTASTAS